eukprot:SAG31_NODE_44117_length_264_cov_0.630303_1_plen_70_part_01
MKLTGIDYTGWLSRLNAADLKMNWSMMNTPHSTTGTNSSQQFRVDRGSWQADVEATWQNRASYPQTHHMG